jgi:hypothetical protein
MTLTPEQVAQFRQEFEAFYSDDREYLLSRDAHSGDYVNEEVDSGWWGYLRAKTDMPDTERCIRNLVIALVESKGWMRSYADAIIRDAIDRTHLLEGEPVAMRYIHTESGGLANDNT